MASLRPYQVADLAFYISHPKCLNLSEPSTGKTPSVCVMSQYIWQTYQHKSVWVQPLSIIEKNRDEILRFTEFKPEEVVIVSGHFTKVRKQLADPKVKVWLMGFDRYSAFWNEMQPDVKGIFVDEIHKGYGGFNSKRTQGFVSSMVHRDWFIGMTGTLVNGRLDSAYPSIHVIEPRYYLSVDQFMNYHGVYDLDNKLIGWKNTDKLSRILGVHGIRHTIKEVYGDQPIVYMTEPVTLATDHRELYDKFEAQALLELDKFFVDGTEPGVGFIRAQQIMEHPNHFPDLAEGKGFIDILNKQRPAKLDRIELHLTDALENKEPIAVFSSMVQQQLEIHALATAMGIKSAVINGSVTPAKRGAIDKAFQAGEIQLLVCSPEVADVGFNWQFSGGKEVKHVIFACHNFMDTTVTQAVLRFARGKRDNPLIVRTLEYKDCAVEQRKLEIIRRKSVLANRVDPTRQILNLSGGNQ